MVCFFDSFAFIQNNTNMYQMFLWSHSWLRWLVLAAILYALYRAAIGYQTKRLFSGTDNAIRHWTATIVHIQFIAGMVVYIKSPIVRYYWKNISEMAGEWSVHFFVWMHPLLMFSATVLITVGSALAKRKQGDREKFGIILFWFALTLLIILLAVPWPFSPLAERPYFR
jgi:hypothetical protein